MDKKASDTNNNKDVKTPFKSDDDTFSLSESSGESIDPENDIKPFLDSIGLSQQDSASKSEKPSNSKHMFKIKEMKVNEIGEITENQ